VEENSSLKLIISRLVKKFIALCSFPRVYTRPQKCSLSWYVSVHSTLSFHICVWCVYIIYAHVCCGLAVVASCWVTQHYTHSPSICGLFRSTRLSWSVHLPSVPKFKADLDNSETSQPYETLPEVTGLIFIWLVQVPALRPVRCGRLSSGTAEGWVWMVIYGGCSGKRMQISDGKVTQRYVVAEWYKLYFYVFH
jgi:hypothetical protein